MSQSKAEAIVARLLSNAAELQYGSVSVMLNIHSGRISNVIYSITENTRDDLHEKTDNILNSTR
ncbi:MAG: hypothetical protein LBH43_18460 [Treponema sp.]|nr:hypothetical protein [Treponema sp.]